MIDTLLLDIICCPETKQDVAIAESELVQKINSAIGKGTLKNRAGAIIEEKIDGALIRLDKKIVYPIKLDIPIMLIDEAIELNQL